MLWTFLCVSGLGSGPFVHQMGFDLMAECLAHQFISWAQKWNASTIKWAGSSFGENCARLWRIPYPAESKMPNKMRKMQSEKRVAEATAFTQWEPSTPKSNFLNEHKRNDEWKSEIGKREKCSPSIIVKLRIIVIYMLEIIVLSNENWQRNEKSTHSMRWRCRVCTHSQLIVRNKLEIVVNKKSRMHIIHFIFEHVILYAAHTHARTHGETQSAADSWQLSSIMTRRRV